jgi:predicted DNA-binding transcriptional regulator AlpA
MQITAQEPQPLITPGEFQRRLGSSRWAFRTWVKNGIIPPPHISQGRITRWKASAVEQLVTNGVQACK